MVLLSGFEPLIDGTSESGNLGSIELLHNLLVVYTQVLCHPVTLVILVGSDYIRFLLLWGFPRYSWMLSSVVLYPD